MINWFYIIVSLLGGLAIFLYGMNLMSDGLNKSAGNKIRVLLQSFTRNRFFSFLTGIVTTGIIQSSSATSVMVISLVKAGILKYRQTFGILLGAGIGTTITAQIIAFKISDYALLIVALGFFLNIISGKQIVKLVGMAVLGFGLLFYGLHLMSEAMSPLRQYQPFLTFLTRLETPWAGILAGFLCTAIIQSSSAFIGIIIVLSSQGLLNLETGIALLLGSNIGTTVTAIIASLNAEYESKRVAVTFFLIKAVGVLLIFFWIPGYAELVHYITAGDNIADPAILPREIANAHTIFNIFVTIILLPFTNIFSSVIEKIIPERKGTGKKPVELKHINNGLLTSPSLALVAAKKEVLHMGDHVKRMLENIILPFTEKDSECLDDIKKEENIVDFLRKETAIFLTGISQQQLKPEMAEESFLILYINAEIEEIADVISSVLVKKAEEWTEEEKHFSAEGKNELVAFHQQTLIHFEKALSIIDTLDQKDAAIMKKEHKKFRQYADELKHKHFERLSNNITDSVRSSKLHMEIMGSLRIIHSHIANIMRIITRNEKK